MKKPFMLAAVLLIGGAFAQAGNRPQSGTIISENSVACGSTVEKGKKNKQMTVEKMKFKANGKSYEYLIVSEAAVAADVTKP